MKREYECKGNADWEATQRQSIRVSFAEAIHQSFIRSYLIYNEPYLVRKLMNSIINKTATKMCVKE